MERVSRVIVSMAPEEIALEGCALQQLEGVVESFDSGD
jgi:hypothetical protein